MSTDLPKPTELNTKLVDDSDQMFKTLFELSPFGIISIDESGSINKLNQRAAEMFGYQENELIGQKIELLIPDRFRKSHVGMRENFVDQSGVRDMSLSADLQGQRKDGSLFPVTISLSTRRTDKGVQVVAGIIDITEKRAKEENHKLARKIIDRSRDCFYHLDVDDGFKVIACNQATIKHFDSSREEILQQHITDWDDSYTVEELDELYETMGENSSLMLETEHLMPDGRRVPVEVSINYYRDPNGRRFAYGWFRDISARKHLDNLKEDAKRSAEAANQAKSDFIANISHEIRTPLNSVIGLSSILEAREDLHMDVAEDVGRIRVAGQMLLSLVNDVLDFSKIEAGEIQLENISVDLESMLIELKTMLSGQLQGKPIELIVDDLPQGASGQVMGDPTRLRQIFLNLLTNAVKFTQQGHVRVSTELVDPISEDGAGIRHQTLRFIIEDTGIGIAKDALDTLFNTFQQADSSITRQYGGTGLGLAIVKQLTGIMGGRVWVESDLGQGARFSVEFPFTLPSSDTKVRNSLELLLAENNRHEREYLVSVSRRLGWNVIAVENGEELLNAYDELVRRGKAVDCVITDWQIPEIDGLEVFRLIEERYSPKQLPKILIVNGGVESSQLSTEPMKSLPDSILTKSVTGEALFNGINQAYVKLFGDAERLLKVTNINAGQFVWLNGVRVLLVDDSPMNLHVTTRILENEGAVVATAHNGAEALDWLMAEGNSVDLILMDVQMPVMDGNTAVGKIRQIDRLMPLPVIALTAGSTVGEHEAAFAAGMDDYLTKPCDREQLVRMIRKQVEEKQTRTIAVAAKI